MPVVAIAALFILGGPLVMGAYRWVHEAALAAARAQVDAWDAAVAARVGDRPSAGWAGCVEAAVGHRWAAAAPVVDALLGLDLPAPVRAAVAAARGELRATAAALHALDTLGAAPDPEGQRSARRAAVTAGLVARFDALLGSVELLIEQAARRVQADDPVVAGARPGGPVRRPPGGGGRRGWPRRAHRLARGKGAAAGLRGGRRRRAPDALRRVHQ